MANILDTIIEQKRSEVRRLRDIRSSFSGGRSDGNRGFEKALNITPQLALVAEVKKASPSKGIIREDFDPVGIAESYEKGQASAVSVLTDEMFFQGQLDFLVNIRAAISLPILRKDFIIDPLQVEETAHVNADGMLLIASALGDGQMNELFYAAREMGIDPLIEIHNGLELDRAMRIGPTLLGINNRDLSTFVTDIQTTIDLLPHIPDNITVIAESGIFTGDDTQRLIDAGANAVLVGESLMREDDPRGLIAELRHLSDM